MTQTFLKFGNNYDEPGFIFISSNPNKEVADLKLKYVSGGYYPSSYDNIFDSKSPFDSAKVNDNSYDKIAFKNKPPFLATLPNKAKTAAVYTRSNTTVEFSIEALDFLEAAVAWFVPASDLVDGVLIDGGNGNLVTMYDLAAQGPPPGYTLFETTIGSSINVDISAVSGVSCAMFVTVNNNAYHTAELDFAPLTISHMPANAKMRPDVYPFAGVTGTIGDGNNWYSSHPYIGITPPTSDTVIDLERFYDSQNYIVKVSNNNYVIYGDGPAAKLKKPNSPPSIDINLPVDTERLFTPQILVAANALTGCSYFDLATAVNPNADSRRWNPIREHMCRRFKAYETALFAPPPSGSRNIVDKHTFNAWTEALIGKYFFNGYGWAFGDFRVRDMALGYRYPNTFYGETLTRDTNYTLGWPVADGSAALINGIASGNGDLSYEDASSLYAAGIAPCALPDPKDGHLAEYIDIGDITYKEGLFPRGIYRQNAKNSVSSDSVPAPSYGQVDGYEPKDMLFSYAMYRQVLDPNPNNGEPFWLDTNFAGPINRKRGHGVGVGVDVVFSPIPWLSKPKLLEDLTVHPPLILVKQIDLDSNSNDDFRMAAKQNGSSPVGGYTSIDRIFIKTHTCANAFPAGFTLYSEEQFVFTGFQCGSSIDSDKPFSDLFDTPTPYLPTVNQNGVLYTITFAPAKIKQSDDCVGVFNFAIRAGNRMGVSRLIVLSLCIEKWRAPIGALSMSDGSAATTPFHGISIDISNLNIVNCTPPSLEFSVPFRSTGPLIPAFTVPDWLSTFMTISLTDNTSLRSLVITPQNAIPSTLDISRPHYISFPVFTDDGLVNGRDSYQHTVVIRFNPPSPLPPQSAIPTFDTPSSPIFDVLEAYETSKVVEITATAQGVPGDKILINCINVGGDGLPLFQLTSTASQAAITFNITPDQVRQYSSSPNRATFDLIATAKGDGKSRSDQSLPLHLCFDTEPARPKIQYTEDNTGPHDLPPNELFSIRIPSKGDKDTIVTTFVAVPNMVDGGEILAQSFRCTVKTGDDSVVFSTISTTDTITIKRSDIGNSLGVVEPNDYLVILSVTARQTFNDFMGVKASPTTSNYSCLMHIVSTLTDTTISKPLLITNSFDVGSASINLKTVPLTESSLFTALAMLAPADQGNKNRTAYIARPDIKLKKVNGSDPPDNTDHLLDYYHYTSLTGLDGFGDMLEIKKQSMSGGPPIQYFTDLGMVDTLEYEYTATAIDMADGSMAVSDPVTVILNFNNSQPIKPPIIEGLCKVDFRNDVAIDSAIVVFRLSCESTAKIRTLPALTNILPIGAGSQNLVDTGKIESKLEVQSPNLATMSVIVKSAKLPMAVGQYYFYVQCSVEGNTTSQTNFNQYLWVLNVTNPNTLGTPIVEFEPSDKILDYRLHNDGNFSFLPVRGMTISSHIGLLPTNSGAVIDFVQAVGVNNGLIYSAAPKTPSSVDQILPQGLLKFNPPPKTVEKVQVVVREKAGTVTKETLDDFIIACYTDESPPIPPTITVVAIDSDGNALDLPPKTIKIYNSEDGTLIFDPPTVRFTASIDFFDAEIVNIGLEHDSSLPGGIKIHNSVMEITPTTLFYGPIKVIASASFGNPKYCSYNTLSIGVTLPNVSEALSPKLECDVDPAVIHFIDGIPHPRSITFTATAVQISAVVSQISVFGFTPEEVDITPSTPGPVMRLTVRPTIDLGPRSIPVSARTKIPFFPNESTPAIRMLYITSDAQTEDTKTAPNTAAVAAVVVICIIVAIAAFIAAYNIAAVI